jgi:hypothetical protein
MKKFKKRKSKRLQQPLESNHSRTQNADLTHITRKDQIATAFAEEISINHTRHRARNCEDYSRIILTIRELFRMIIFTTQS